MSWQELIAKTKEILSIHLLEFGGTVITPQSVIVFLFILFVTWVISRLIGRALMRFFGSKTNAKDGSLKAMKRLTHYVVMLIGFAIALQSVGIKMQALFAAGAVFAVAIGFAMQNIVQNFVSGVILLIERTIKPGDILEVEGRIVKITQMGIRATIARTRDDEDIIIPNATLVQSSVKNYTMRDTVYRLNAYVGVAYESDMKQVNETLLNAASEIPWRIQEKEPQVYMEEFASSSVNFRVVIWVDNPWRSNNMISDFNNRIWWALKVAGISISYPQMDVHFDKPVAEAIAGIKKD